MRKYKHSVLVFGSCFVAIGMGSNVLANELKSAKALHWTFDNRTLNATVTPGHHFNQEAPNQLVVHNSSTLSPTSIKAREIQFDKVSSTEQGITASLYVCDDALTYCDKHEIELEKGAEPIASKKLTPKKSASRGAESSHGFLDLPLTQAIELAKQKKKLLLVDFGADWCPGCVKLEQETFANKEFQRLAKNYLKVKVNVDDFSSFPHSEKYKITGIPAVVVMDSDGQEISRLIDFQPVGKFRSLFKEVEKDSSPLNLQLAKLNSLSPTAKENLVRRLYHSNQISKAFEIVKSSGITAPISLSIDFSQAKEEYEKDKNKKQFLERVQSLLAREGNSSRALYWRAEVIDILETKELQQEWLTLVGSQVREWLASKEKLKAAVATDDLGEFKEFESLYVAMLLAEVHEAVESAEAPKHWKLAYDVGVESKIPLANRGNNLRFFMIAIRAKKFNEALALADKLLKKYPDDFEIQRRILRPLLEVGELQRAEKIARAILPKARGRNEFWVVESLAKILKAQKNHAGALQLLDSYLARDELKMEKMRGTKKSIEELKQSIQKEADQGKS